jgi:ankyrin repeat domain-containing protein 50
MHREERLLPPLDETVDTLRHELSKFKKLFCVIDGLDEAEKKTRVALIRESAQFPSLRLLITGRPFVENVPQNIIGNDCHRVEILASDGDIQKFVKGEIENFDKHLRKKVELEKYEEVLVDTVTKKANGMYVLRSLHVMCDSDVGQVSHCPTSDDASARPGHLQGPNRSYRRVA